MSIDRSATVGMPRFWSTFAVVLGVALGSAGCGENSDGGECAADEDCDGELVCSLGSCVDPNGLNPVGNNNNNGNINGNGNTNNPAPNDTQGPTIVIREPDPYEVQSGTITILVDVLDTGAGVDNASVYAIVADQELIPLTPANGSLNTYSAPLDTRTYRNQLSASLEIAAADLNGNETVVGNSFVLDYAGPALDMEPRDIRPFSDFNFNDIGITCGGVVKTLGDTALRDGQIIAPSIPAAAPNPDAYQPFLGLAFYPRVEIVDRSSEGDYNVLTTVSGVSEESVYFALLDQDAIAAGRPLLVSSENRTDNVCDAINPDVIPEAGGQALDAPVAVIQDAVRAPVIGSPDFSLSYAETREPGVTSTVPPFPCTRWGYPLDVLITRESPCESVDPQWSVYAAGESNGLVTLSRVFVANELNIASEVTCAGGFFDSLNLVADGPACVAAYGEDLIGNQAVSAPLYICIDKDGVGGECDGFAPTLADKLNACTNGCVPEDPGGDPRRDPPRSESF